jgi:hypothetical protein
MKGITRTTIFVVLVLILTAAMATTAFAKPKADKGGGGGGGITPLAIHTVYADDPGWVTTGTWVVEDYTGLETDGTKILVANDAGATATYTFGPDVSQQWVEVYSSMYQFCGDMSVKIDRKDAVTMPLYYSGTPATWNNRVFRGRFQNYSGDHTVTITCLGTNGSPTYPYLHFVNIQYLYTYP